MSISLLFADAHHLVREGLVALIERDGVVEVVGQTGDGREAVRLAKQLQPDVIILDTALPRLNGIDAARNILAAQPKAKILALSAHWQEYAIEQLLAAGVLGYVSKTSTADELAKAIGAVHAGEMYLCPTLAGRVLRRFHLLASGREQPSRPLLSGREREVLQLVAEGNSTKAIAAALHLSHNTVVRHRQNIMDKLELHSVAELTRYAIREGLSSIH